MSFYFHGALKPQKYLTNYFPFKLPLYFIISKYLAICENVSPFVTATRKKVLDIVVLAFVLIPRISDWSVLNDHIFSIH